MHNILNQGCVDCAIWLYYFTIDSHEQILVFVLFLESCKSFLKRRFLRRCLGQRLGDLNILFEIMCLAVKSIQIWMSVNNRLESWIFRDQLPSSFNIFKPVKMLLLMEKLIVGIDVVSINCRTMPNISWAPSGHIKFRCHLGILLVADSFIVHHTIPSRSDCLLIEFFLLFDGFQFVFLIYNFLDVPSRVHYVFVLLFTSESFSMPMPLVKVLNVLFFWLRCISFVFILVHIQIARLVRIC